MYQSPEHFVAALPDVPGPVKNLQVVDTADGEVSLVWEEPESDGGSKVIGYVVERRDVKRKTWTLATDQAESPEYTVSGLQRDSMYLFRVCARNRVGSGPAVETDKPVQAKNKFGKWTIKWVSGRMFRFPDTLLLILDSMCRRSRRSSERHRRKRHQVRLQCLLGDPPVRRRFSHHLLHCGTA